MARVEVLVIDRQIKKQKIFSRVSLKLRKTIFMYLIIRENLVSSSSCFSRLSARIGFWRTGTATRRPAPVGLREGLVRWNPGGWMLRWNPGGQRWIFLNDWKVQMGSNQGRIQVGGGGEFQWHQSHPLSRSQKGIWHKSICVPIVSSICLPI